MFYILFGLDEFSLREELERIKDGLGDRESLSSNTTTFEGKQVSLNQLMDACIALPFLGSHRLIIVEGLLSRFEGNRLELKKGDEGGWGEFEKKVGDMPPSTVLILVDGQIKKGNALLKRLAPLASVKEFPLLKGTALGEWILGRVKEGQGTISPEAVRMLALLVGENLWVLASEIEKLLLYTAGRRIDEGDVKEVVSYAREANVFTMVDALIEGRVARAAPLLHQLLQEGDTAPYLLVMITRQLRLLVQAKDLSLQGFSAAEVKARLALTSDYVLNKALEQGRRYSMERLEQVYRKLLETDLSIKRGLWRGELALDLLVAELCA
ncbi:MAG: DNA polymerase III subunit delta [Dehalococcoidia bacterium]|nr:DNA polymerase III subunit delta [Dehalococcoidia bacterium]